MSSRRVLLAQAYFLRFDPKLQEGAQPSPPLGSLICAAVLRDRGCDVRFFDSMLAGSEDDCAAAMNRERPDTLVLFEDNFNYLTKMCLARMREAAVRMIVMARERGIEAVLAGSDASDDPGFFLRAGASAVAVGEGEFAVADWLQAPWATRGTVPGMATLNPEGAVVSGPARGMVQNLDSIPSPAWDLIDLDAYRRVWGRERAPLCLPLATSRGCPFHCNWCAKPIWGQRHNTVSPSRAAREVLTLKRLGAGKVNVLDDIFGLRPGWMEEFAAELARLNCVLPFKCLSRADLLTDRLVRALKGAGCEMVWIGAESGSQKILDAMEKGTTVEEIKAAAARLRSHRIKVGFFLQFGYPGETEEDVRATLSLADEVLPDDIGISVSYPLPGTRFHERVKGEMSAATHWRDSSDLAMLFASPRGTRYYRRLHAYAHARFRLALALGNREGGLPRRSMTVIWRGAKRLIAGLALALVARERIRTRSMLPELSRERAATPTTRALSGLGDL
ncbi:MAG: B12-binding domain-containing radical SAM protein [Vicinamibacteria bacterium]|nr:B12-binding domain-containing radical SAM protein [Vicinamibacteria bacterium]